MISEVMLIIIKNDWASYNHKIQEQHCQNVLYTITFSIIVHINKFLK